MVSYCLDTSAWLEYLNAGLHGPRVRAFLQSDRAIYTPAVVAAEIIEAARRRRENTRTFLEFLGARTQLVPVGPEVARLAGKINAVRSDRVEGWTMLESLVWATARSVRARLVTRDPIYQDLEEVELLGWVRGVGGPRATA